ncbi:MAG: PPC domain-containing protein, partial [Pleurocapsa sp.]
MTTNHINSGNTLSQAWDIGLLNSSFYHAQWVGSSDVRDIYSFTTHQAGDLNFWIKGLSNNANIQLLDDDGNIISGSYNTGTQTDSATFGNLQAGDYYIKVYSNNPGTIYNLGLRLNLRDANNYVGNAQNVGVITEEKHIIGSVGSYDVRDVYRFTTH